MTENKKIIKIRKQENYKGEKQENATDNNLKS